MKKLVLATLAGLAGSLLADVTNVRYLDYVSFPKGAWVDTGIVPDGKETKIVFDCEYLHDGDVFGTKDGETYYTLKMNNNNWRWGVAGTANNGGSWIGSYSGLWSKGKHTAVFNQLTTGDFLLDGEVMKSVSGAKSMTSKTLMIGCARSNTNSANLTGKVYSLTISDADGVVCNLVPCAYTEDGVEKVGFYETVGEKYLTCTRTGYALTAGNDRTGELTVTGWPFEAASYADPVDYGTRTGLTGEVTLTAPAKVRFTFGCAATCTGFKLYSVDPVTGAKTQVSEGTGASCTYTPAGAPAVLEWQWNVSTPIKAEGTVYCVSPMGDDANDGSDWTKALRNPQTAIDRSAAGDVVLLASGKYTSTETLYNNSIDYLTCLRLAKAVRVIGLGGAEATVMDASSNRPRNGAYVSAADAFLSGIAFTNTAYYYKARNIGVEVSAGTVSNVVINVRQSWSSKLFHVTATKGNALAQDIRFGDLSVYRTSGEGENPIAIESSTSYDATIDGFTLRGVTFGANNMGGQMLTLTGQKGHPATLRNALLVDNAVGDDVNNKRGNLVYLNNFSCLANATIANNDCRGPSSALRINGATETVVTNCIICGNTTATGTYGDIYGNSNTKVISTTLCDQLEAGVRGNLNGAPGFMDAKKGDYRLTGASQCVNAGGQATGDDSGLGAADVAGNVRVVGGAVDLGAYEHQDPAAFAADYTAVAGANNTVTFTGNVNGSADGVTASWNFGDGSPASTDWPVASHVYANPGAYTVTLTVTRGGETATRTLAGGAVVVPPVCYVAAGATGVYPYDTWEKATDDLQAAIDVGSAKVLVGPGTYTLPANNLAQSIVVNHAVEVASSEGPETTILDSSMNVISVSHRFFDIQHEGAFVHGFTLKGGYHDYGKTGQGYPWAAGVEMNAGILSNCFFRNGIKVSRGMLIRLIGTAKLLDCDINGRGLLFENGTNPQGGLYLQDNALVDRCKIYGFKVPGAYDVSTSQQGPVMLNGANCEIRNTLIHSCTNASTAAHVNYGGVVQIVNGKLANCTVVDNYCGGKGAVKFFANAGTATLGSVVNSVVRDNVALMDDGSGAYNDFYAATAGASVTFTCAGSFGGLAGGAGEGCTTANPNFAKDGSHQLTSLSAACLGKATALDWMAGSLDLAHNPRVDVKKGAPDLGCYEFVYSTEPEPLQVEVDVQNGVSRTPVVATLTATVVGGGDTHTTTWDFGDGSPLDTTSGDVVTHTYATPGVYAVKVTVQSGEETVTVTLDSASITVIPKTCYVAENGAGVYPYASWETAATNVLDALALNPETVLVDDGVYAVSGQGISIAQDVVLKSRNGAAKTTIRGSQRWSGNTCDSAKLFSLAHADARIEGFTLSEGYTPTQDDAICGKITAGTLANCVITNCIPSYRSPVLKLEGVESHVVDCVIDLKPYDNHKTSSNADGRYFFSVVLLNGATMDRCEVKNAAYTNQGGQNASHKAAVHMIGGSVMRNSLVHHCQITQKGLIGKDPSNPSATYGLRSGAVVVWGTATVENCTIADNVVWHDAGLTIVPAEDTKAYTTYAPGVTNNICWGNVSTNKTDGTWKVFDVCDVTNTKVEDAYLAEPRVGFCCAGNLTAGVNGNLTADPLFTTRKSRPAYSLRAGSPCIDAASTAEWMTGATDLSGRPRIVCSRPDLGCYECAAGGFLLIVR